MSYFKNKYLKYKNKYLKNRLKNQIGGNNFEIFEKIINDVSTNPENKDKQIIIDSLIKENNNNFFINSVLKYFFTYIMKNIGLRNINFLTALRNEDYKILYKKTNIVENEKFNKIINCELTENVIIDFIICFHKETYSPICHRIQKISESENYSVDDWSYYLFLITLLDYFNKNKIFFIKNLQQLIKETQNYFFITAIIDLIMPDKETEEYILISDTKKIEHRDNIFVTSFIQNILIYLIENKNEIPLFLESLKKKDYTILEKKTNIFYDTSFKETINKLLNTQSIETIIGEFLLTKNLSIEHWTIVLFLQDLIEYMVKNNISDITTSEILKDIYKDQITVDFLKEIPVLLDTSSVVKLINHDKWLDCFNVNQHHAILPNEGVRCDIKITRHYKFNESDNRSDIIDDKNLTLNCIDKQIQLSFGQFGKMCKSIEQMNVDKDEIIKKFIFNNYNNAPIYKNELLYGNITDYTRPRYDGWSYHQQYYGIYWGIGAIDSTDEDKDSVKYAIDVYKNLKLSALQVSLFITNKAFVILREKEASNPVNVLFYYTGSEFQKSVYLAFKDSFKDEIVFIKNFESIYEVDDNGNKIKIIIREFDSNKKTINEISIDKDIFKKGQLYLISIVLDKNQWFCPQKKTFKIIFGGDEISCGITNISDMSCEV